MRRKISPGQGRLRQAAQMALLARLIFCGLNAVFDEESGFWIYPEAWTPDCDALCRQGYARLKENAVNKKFARLEATASGKAALLKALGEAFFTELDAPAPAPSGYDLYAREEE